MGGETALLVHRGIEHHAVSVPGLRNLEAAVTGIKLAGKPAKILAVSLSLSRPLIKSDLSTCLSGRLLILMAGDLNAKHIDWTTRLTTLRGKLLRDYADRHPCLIYGPDSSTPDVIYRHNQRPSIPVHLIACSALSSDHLPILIDTGSRSSFLNVHDRLDFRWTDWKTEMGGACGTYGGEVWCTQGFRGEI